MKNDDVIKVLNITNDKDEYICKMPEGIKRVDLIFVDVEIIGFDNRQKGGYFFAFVKLIDGQFMAIWEAHCHLFNSMDEVDPAKLNEPCDTILNKLELRCLDLI